MECSDCVVSEVLCGLLNSNPKAKISYTEKSREEIVTTLRPSVDVLQKMAPVDEG